MKKEELIKELESVKLPEIEFESHQRRLKMALLKSDYFKKKQGGSSMESIKEVALGLRSTITNNLNMHYPVWKAALISIFAVIVIFVALISIPQTSRVMKSMFFPEGTRVIGGPQLTAEELKQATNILMADPRIQEMLAQGVVIDKILPIEVGAERINPETGETELVKETWAQAWLVRGEKDWGVQVDLVRGKVVAISP